MNIKKIKYCVAVAILVIATAFCGCGSNDEQIIDIKPEAKSQNEKTGPEIVVQKDDDTESEKITQKIRVYVCGAVRAPDVYTLDPDVRMIDAVNAAGGFSEEAAEEYVNLAARIEDGQKIYIPTYEEIEQAPVAENETAGSSAGENSTGTGGKVNINSADKATLMTLPGVGESKADKIIDYRQTNGGFKTVEDIMLVAGIKEGMYNKIKDFICVN